MVMDWNEGRVFVEVVRNGSFIGAARALEIPRSTVSRRIASLEERLGARLLQRTTRKMSLTEVGQAFFERCSRAVDEMTAAEALVRSRQDEPAGRVRLTVPVSAGPGLSHFLFGFLERYPRVELELDLSDRAVDMIEEGYDLAIRGGRVTEPHLIARRLYEGRTLFCASPAYIARHGHPRHPSELAEHDCILSQHTVEQEKRMWLVDDKGTRTPALEGRFVANALDVIHAAARAGLGVARVPALYARTSIERGELVRVLEDYCVSSGIYAVYPSRNNLPVAVRLLIDGLAKDFSARQLLESE